MNQSILKIEKFLHTDKMRKTIAKCFEPEADPCSYRSL